MKSPLILFASLAGAAFASPVIKDRITPEEIAQRQKSAPVAVIQQAADGKDAAVARPGGESLIQQSDILSDGHNWTLVPKNAVLHVPQALANRVGAKPLGRLLAWTDFLTVNRGWLFTEEITFDQAAGKTPIPPSRSEFWKKNGKVIVAVHLGGPISVKPEATTPVAATP